MQLSEQWQVCRDNFQSFVTAYFKDDNQLLAESMLYTLKQGKKFRPFLTHATAKIYNDNTRLVLAYSTAIEMVHAFSLIHDDLPALDNDDYRRGEKTSHKVYGEDVAILSGDALLNEAYLIIAEYYKENPKRALKLVQLLASAVGRQGMIEGQIRDLKAQKKEVKIQDLKNIHNLKTGCLIQASILGAAYIYDASEKDCDALSEYGKNLGLAFQIADDLLEKEDELGSYVNLLGREGAKNALNEVSDLAIKSLESFGERASLLRDLVQENQNRRF